MLVQGEGDAGFGIKNLLLRKALEVISLGYEKAVITRYLIALCTKVSMSLQRPFNQVLGGE
ncbi:MULTISPECIES: hypothetical protein [Pseudoalteromonas]|uniref:hypothetical protein n=1 Tax=Pseudoalteromonas TaxID=53246 RepID=UPI000420EA09|nr:MULTISPECIES: hypothetical protein [Pseudoalteromonas]KZN37070.1 hypothetical protein N483_21735 [Pseudoalteromonas luteoviolacea NCIMB 1944]MCG7549999.1 hypothetical protein [Pseudoalteromonas sp. Of7M-16]